MPLPADRELAWRLNRVVDRGLEGRHLPVLPLLRISGEPHRLAERIRRRAARRIRLVPACARATLARRDRLILAIYARTAGTDRVAWCDASWRPGSDLIGAAALLSDSHGEIRGSIQKHSRGEPDAVAAEAFAVTLAIEKAAAQRVDSLTAYTDCAALVQLWQARRRDPRLRGLREAAGALSHFRVRLIRRAHNQPAHRLAREAAQESG